MNASLAPSQISAVLGRIGYFRDLHGVALDKLSARTRQITVRRDEVVFRKGDPANDLYLVVNGLVKLLLALPNQGEKVVSLVGHGESFGIAALWLGLPHPVSAVAKTDSHLLLLDRHAIMHQARAESVVAERLLTDLSHRVMDLLHDLESCTPRSSLQRVSCFLLQQRPDMAMNSYDILLPTIKRDIAAKLNLTQETLSRTFQQLSRDGVIQVRGRTIHVLDSGRLQDFKRGNSLPPVRSKRA